MATLQEVQADLAILVAEFNTLKTDNANLVQQVATLTAELAAGNTEAADLDELDSAIKAVITPTVEAPVPDSVPVEPVA